ncbi:MAG: Adenosine 5'-monophosphoramidase [Heterodermia speciosa]|uniref:Adenosine 5'-monophosphoramidase n=1 Tax=Heterodermia speciosa TaxID=116794 RepID=A0A8H3F9H2_9LECA|nr:MAG: Adenosine 5'-monophosphoramidase [Heterodermia speciosa]
MASCIFCKIIKGDIPAFKLFESEKVLAFLDIQPLSYGHAVCAMLPVMIILVIPKHHGALLTDIPDEALSEILRKPVAKKVAVASGAEQYNLLQNNGRLAHQIVDHVHFHVIPKPSPEEGLGISWPAKETDMDKLKTLFNEIKAKM